MPASGGDPIGSYLRVGFSAGKAASSLENGLEVSVKRVLSSSVQYEPISNYKSSVLSSLKSKYQVIEAKAAGSNVVKNGVCNGNSKKNTTPKLPSPKCTLFPFERIQLGFRGSVSIGSGMTNLGNTCYLNSTLQALFHVPAFVNWIANDPAHSKCEQNSDVQLHPDDIMCATVKTFKCSQQKTGTVMKPSCIYSKLKAICKHLSHGSQEDAHEFMRYLLESLEKGFLHRIQGQNLECWSKETTPVNQIFGGYIRTEVTCLSCGAVSTTFQHFQDLPLDIRRASTLADALSGYFERERLPEGEDAYKCEKCGRKVSATKKFSVERPPNVLCVQLKRFSALNGKLTKQVQLPLHLDLSRHLSPTVQSRQPVRYRLVSMVTHMGQSANCGHYTAIALAANGSYYQFDDTFVRPISISNVLNMSAYLVLYELERPFPPQSPRPSNPGGDLAQKESESASVGGSEAKEPANGGSPTAGSPAPHTSPIPVSASLVPYESDADSDNENKTDSLGFWKITSVAKCSNGSSSAPAPTAPLTVYPSTWRVTDATSSPRKKEESQKSETTATSGNDPVGSSTREENEKLCESIVRETAKRRDVVTQLVQNSHRGYGSNQVMTWNEQPSALEREVVQERRDNRKRSYADSYNSEFDRGKVKKQKTFNNHSTYRRDNRHRPYNPFQAKANQHKNNGYNRYNRFDYSGSNRNNNGNHWGGGFRRNHHKKHFYYQNKRY